MNRKRIIIIESLILLIFGVSAVGLAWGLSTAHDIQARETAGRFVAGFPLEDGGEIVVTIRTPSGGQYLDFVYFPTGEDWFNLSEIELPYAEPPDAVDAWACGRYVHVFMWWDEAEATHIYRWRIPVEINTVFLPVVCRNGR